jgi:carbon-monoxide dehydrogenase medium subunit
MTTANQSVAETPGGFRYLRARTVDEAVAQLAAGATVIAGGTVLGPEVAREGRDGSFVDISGIAPLRTLRVDVHGVSIGALVSNEEISRHPELVRGYVALSTAAGRIGNPHIRRAGTIGGNLAWALPRACLPPALLALDAEVTLRNIQGVSKQPVSQLLRSGLPASTLLESVQLPPSADRRSGYLKYAWRHATAMALVIVSVSFRRDADGVMQEPRVTAGGLCRARRLPTAEGMLAGRKLDGVLVNEVARIAAAEPPFEETGTAPGEAFRRHLVAAGVRRLLSEI